MTTKNTSDQAFRLLAHNGDTFIQIINETLRRFIWEQIEDQNLVNRAVLYEAGDDVLAKTHKDRAAAYPVGYAVQQWTSWFDECGSNIANNLYPQYARIVTDVTKLGSALSDIRTQFLSDSRTALQGGKLSFIRLSFALNQEDLYLCVRKEDTLYAGKIIEVEYSNGGWFTPPHLNITLNVYSHSGKRMKPARTSFAIYEYNGEVDLTDLGIVPLTDEVRQQLIERGKRYHAYTEEPRYLHYTGTLLRRSWWSTNTFRATGRVMVDLLAMKSIDPDYRQYFAMDRNSDEDNNDTTKEHFTDEMFMCMSPYVYGFSFSAKTWGEMNIDHLSDIKFRDDAYDMLVMPAETKDMLFALVESNRVVGRDFIDGKGGGCIFLLAGSPGTGKTLTAESIAERLKQPLYMVGVGELGTNVESLEENLRNILDVATSWKAVLLLDEADIFMEKRDDVNIERNAMVGVFLRMLEYYQGTLFLTTNRAKSIDTAFYSRISLAIKYEDLGLDSRRIIWSNILNLYELKDIDIVRLSDFDINGRQIKNVTRIVTALTNRNGTIPTTEDFVKVIDHVIKFE